MSNHTTPVAAAHLVGAMIACTSYDICRQLLPKQISREGKLYKTNVLTADVIKRVPAILSFEQRFAPLTVDANGRFQREHGRDKIYLVPFWYERIRISADNVIKLMAEAKDLPGVMPLIAHYAGLRCAEAKGGDVWSIPNVPDKLHKPTLEMVDAASEFVADRAAFLGFRVHSAVKSVYPSQYSARSNMIGHAELVDIIERGVVLEEEGDRLEELTATFDRMEAFNDHTTLAEAFGTMGNASHMQADNRLPLEEYTRIAPVAEAAQNWYSWVEVLPSGLEQFANNVSMKIEQAKEMANQARQGREQLSYELGDCLGDDPNAVEFEAPRPKNG